MSRLGINTGNNPNDGQGDPLRVAMGKINSNFLEIYNSIGDGFDLISYASTAGISTLARNLTGSPRINVSGILNTGITTTEHIEVRNITSTGVVTATQFVGDGSQLTNVTALVGGLEVLDDNVRKGVARELNFGENIISTGPDGVGRVTISVPSTLETSVEYSTAAGIATVAQGLTGTPNISVGVITATSFVGDGSQLTGISGGSNDAWTVTSVGIHTSKNVGIGTTAESDKILYVRGLPDKTVSIAATSIIGYGYENSIRLSKDGFLFPDFYGAVGNDLGLEIPIGVGDFEVNSVLAKFRQTLQVGTIGVGQSACVFIDARGYMGQGGGQGGPWIGVGAGVSINGSAGGNIQVGITTGGTGVNIRGNNGSINATGIITANKFVGDGSGLTNIVATGAGVEIRSNGTPVGTAGTINFSSNLNVSLGSGIATVSGASSVSAATTAFSLAPNTNINVGQVGISSFLSVSGIVSFFNDVHFEYDRAVLIGNNDELQLYHNGTNSYIDNSSGGNLIIRAHGGSIQLQKEGPELMGVFDTDGGVELYYDNVKKFETTGYGVSISGDLNVSGVITASSFSGSGTNLTGIITSLVAGTNVTITQSSGIATISASGGTNIVGIATTGTSFFNQLNVSGVSTFSGITTNTSTLFANQLSVSGVSTFAGITTVTGVSLFSRQLSVSGVSTFAGITTVTGVTLFTRQLNVSGIATASSFVGAGTSLTGLDASNISLGTLTNSRLPSDISVSGVVTATRFESTSSGTPTIGAATTISLETIKVAISTDITVGRNVNVSGITTTGILNVGTGGTVITTTTSGNVGVGTTNSTETLSVLGKIQILQDNGSNSRLIFRGTNSSPYRWSIDNYQSGNLFRIFREDDATSANGSVGLQIDPAGNTTISGITTIGLGSTSTPPTNSQMSFELTSNTNLRIKVRGTDGVLRTANITLA